MYSVECFKGFPLEYESFLIKKYDSFVTTCRYIEIFNTTADMHYMLIHDNNSLVDVFIFDNKGNSSLCLNSLAQLDLNILGIFTENLFKNYPSVNKIEFRSTYSNNLLDKSILTLRSDDFIINLPPSIDEYFQQLGSSTRSNVRKHKNKFLRDFPQANFVTKIGAEIEQSLIDKIIRLNFERIISKREVPHADHTLTKSHYRFSQHYGCVTYIEIDGLIVAGCIAYMSNGSMYSNFLSHDNNYSTYNAGQLCMLYLIQVSIEKGFSDFHLMSGECEYKTRFLAKPRPMYSNTVYKKVSIPFIISKEKEFYSRILYRIKLYKFVIPLKDIYKKFRKKSTKQLCKLEYIVLLIITLSYVA